MAVSSRGALWPSDIGIFPLRWLCRVLFEEESIFRSHSFRIVARVCLHAVRGAVGVAYGSGMEVESRLIVVDINLNGNACARKKK